MSIVLQARIGLTIMIFSLGPDGIESEDDFKNGQQPRVVLNFLQAQNHLLESASRAAMRSGVGG